MKYINALIFSFILLLVFYAGFVVWSINQYKAYYNAVLSRYPESLRPYVDPLPYRDFWYGETAIGLGLVLIIAGMTLILFLSQRANVKVSSIVMSYGWKAEGDSLRRRVTA